MKRSSFLSGLLLLALVSVPVMSQAAVFLDVPDTHPQRRAIEHLKVAGVLQGYADGNFRPAFSINRAELLKVLVAATMSTNPNFSITDERYRRCFPDVTDQWFAPYVCYAALQGWVQGYPDGTFGPEKPVNFVEAVKMLMNVRGYPPAPKEEIQRRGLDPTVWFTPYLTTAILFDVVSYDQVWGISAIPLQKSLDRGTVAEFVYRALLAEGLIQEPLVLDACDAIPTSLEIKTFVDVVLPSNTRVFRQELWGRDNASRSCLLTADANPFSNVTAAYANTFLQPYPGGQPKNTWTVNVPLHNGRAVLRGGTNDGVFLPQLFVADIRGGVGVLRQLPSLFASLGGTVTSSDGKYAAYIGPDGMTVSAIDLTTGESDVIDLARSPLTYFPSAEEKENIQFSTSSPHVVTYALYDSSVQSGTGYLQLEVHTKDLDVFFASHSGSTTQP